MKWSRNRLTLNHAVGFALDRIALRAVEWESAVEHFSKRIHYTADEFITYLNRKNLTGRFDGHSLFHLACITKHDDFHRVFLEVERHTEERLLLIERILERHTARELEHHHFTHHDIVES